MSMLRQFLEAAAADWPVYISDVRDAFQREGTRPFTFHAVPTTAAHGASR